MIQEWTDYHSTYDSRIRDDQLPTDQCHVAGSCHTASRYQPGIGIAFHVDAHSAFEEGIAAITLGSGIAPGWQQLVMSG